MTLSLSLSLSRSCSCSSCQVFRALNCIRVWAKARESIQIEVALSLSLSLSSLFRQGICKQRVSIYSLGWRGRMDQVYWLGHLNIVRLQVQAVVLLASQNGHLNRYVDREQEQMDRTSQLKVKLICTLVTLCTCQLQQLNVTVTDGNQFSTSLWVASSTSASSEPPDHPHHPTSEGKVHPQVIKESNISSFDGAIGTIFHLMSYCRATVKYIKWPHQCTQPNSPLYIITQAKWWWCSTFVALGDALVNKLPHITAKARQIINSIYPNQWAKESNKDTYFGNTHLPNLWSSCPHLSPLDLPKRKLRNSRGLIS